MVLLAPDLKGGAVPATSRRRRQRFDSDHEFTPTGSGLTRHAWRSIRHGAGDAGSVISATLADADVQAQLSSGPVVVVAVATSADVEFAALRQLMTAVDGAGAPGVGRACRWPLQLVCSTTAASDTTSTLTAAANGQIEYSSYSAAIRSPFPDRELAIAA